MHTEPVALRSPPRPAVHPAERAPACAHCGQPVPDALVDAQSDLQFCCSGCRIVCNMLREHALDGYYRQRDSEPRASSATPALATGRDYAEFDDPRFLALYARSRGDD